MSSPATPHNPLYQDYKSQDCMSLGHSPAGRHRARLEASGECPSIATPGPYTRVDLVARERQLDLHGNVRCKLSARHDNRARIRCRRLQRAIAVGGVDAQLLRISSRWQRQPHLRGIT